MAGAVETERKYELDPGQTLPSLAAVASEGEVAEFTLEATYYDAPDYRLTRAWQVVRRRTGGSDEGWHLKLPGASPDQRIELRLPLDPPRLPQELREQVAQTLAGAPVVPVAVLRTHRREQQLLGRDGAVLAVTCTDQVRATVAGREQCWREAEVELVTGDVALLDRVEAVLAAAGIRRAGTGSKIARALDRALAASQVRDRSAGGTVLAYAAEQVGVLQDREVGVRADAPDAVHRSRVATRRLRSVLRTYADVFSAGTTRALRDELRWHAEELGPPRDAEVLRERLLASLSGLAAAERELVAGRIRESLDATHAAAHRKLVESMDTPRYDRLQAGLELLLTAPRLGGPAADPAEVALPPLQARAVERARRLGVLAAARPGDLTRWHEVRKAAKAARYGAEVLVRCQGAPAEDARARWEAVTEALGAVQDAVVAQQVIGDLAWHAVAEGLPRLPFDELRHQQDALRRESLARGRTALDAALGDPVR